MHLERVGKVLWVDDEEETCHLMTMILQKMGYEINYATSIREAKEKLQSFRLDAAYIDLNLPDGLGFQLIEDIKKKNPEARIVLVSAQDLGRHRAIEVGAHDFISKPFSKKVIEKSLNKINFVNL